MQSLQLVSKNGGSMPAELTDAEAVWGENLKPVKDPRLHELRESLASVLLLIAEAFGDDELNDEDDEAILRLERNVLSLCAEER